MQRSGLVEPRDITRQKTMRIAIEEQETFDVSSVGKGL